MNSDGRQEGQTERMKKWEKKRQKERVGKLLRYGGCSNCACVLRIFVLAVLPYGEQLMSAGVSDIVTQDGVA